MNREVREGVAEGTARSWRETVAMAYIERRRVHDADAHIMEPPTWLRDHADPDIRDRTGDPRLRERARTDRRRRSRRRSRPRRARRHLCPTRRSPPLRRVPQRRSRRRDEPQELRSDGVLPGRGSTACPRLHRRRQPADVQHIPQLAVVRVGAPGRERTSRPRPGLRRRPCAQPWNDRVLFRRRAPAAHVLRPPRRLRPRRGHGGRGDRDGRRRVARRLRMPSRPLAVAPLARSGLASGGGSRHPGRVPRRRNRRSDRPCVLRERAPDPARFPRRRGELPIGRLHGDPVPTHADARNDDLRRCARTAPATAGRRHRAGLHLAAELAQADGVRDGRIRSPRGAPPRAVARHRASTWSARFASPPTRPRTSAGSPTRSAPTSCCSTPTTHTSKAGGARSSGSRTSLGDRSEAVRERFYADNFIDLMGSAVGALV